MKFKCIEGAGKRGCGHIFDVVKQKYACPSGMRGYSCGMDNPVTCKAPGKCWGCTPCGRSKREYRCSMCAPDCSCPKCHNVYVKRL